MIIYQNVSHLPYINIARLCGGVTINKIHYTYLPELDLLVKKNLEAKLKKHLKQKKSIEDFFKLYPNEK